MSAKEEEDVTSKLIAQLRDHLHALPINTFDSADLTVLTHQVRTLEQATASTKIRVAQQATDLAMSGEGPDASETLLHAGGVSAQTARQETSRARAAANMPTFAAALQQGCIGAEHLDTLTP